jgi:predicted Zn finger-like uncharacterized protein
MNNACPNCGAVYAVTARDIGRKLKCKKCSSALIVTDAGLVLDGPVAAAPQSTARPVAMDIDDEDAGEGEEVVIVSKGKKGKSRQGRGGSGLGELLAKVGGISTMLFAFGVFLVIWFTFMPKIGEAAALRAEALTQKLDAEAEAKAKDKLPKGKTEMTLSEDERKKYMDDVKKILEDYGPQLREAESDARVARISMVRSLWYDRYGLMFGFIFVAFGCIGYLRTDQPLIMRIVAAVILGVMMIIVFGTFGGCSIREEKTPSVPATTPSKMGGGVGKAGPGGF